MKMTRAQAAIKLDLDNVPGEAPLDDIHRLLGRAGYRAKDVTCRRSPSGNGWHIILIVQPRPQSPYEVVALQAILGGDRNREAMQMHRAKAFPEVPVWMRDKWNVLYLPDKNRQRHASLGSER